MYHCWHLYSDCFIELSHSTLLVWCRSQQITNIYFQYFGNFDKIIKRGLYFI